MSKTSDRRLPLASSCVLLPAVCNLISENSLAVVIHYPCFSLLISWQPKSSGESWAAILSPRRKRRVLWRWGFCRVEDLTPCIWDKVSVLRQTITSAFQYSLKFLPLGGKGNLKKLRGGVKFCCCVLLIGDIRDKQVCYALFRKNEENSLKNAKWGNILNLIFSLAWRIIRCQKNASIRLVKHEAGLSLWLLVFYSRYDNY